ncbi:MAG: hypothetical protein JWQ10_3899 [Herbaspirillum sp.]|nr:hypothetical protein [Herbaspirillum sp.]
MLLYYYTGKQWGMKSLWERRLKIAKYEDLNDPFELLPFIQTDREARRYYKTVVRVLSANHGVLCFSKSWRSTLMWAHYAEKHTGMCLEFEIEENQFLTKIDYVNQRLDSPIDFTKPLHSADESMLVRCLNVKHSGWQYEKEYRLRVSLNDERDGIYYNPFNNGMQLRRVIIGARCTLTNVEVAEAVGTEPDADVRISTARAAHGSFSMCTDQTVKIHTITGKTEEIKKQQRLAKALLEYGGK